MENIENRMLVDTEWEDLETHTNWEEYYNNLAEQDDIRYQDEIFEEMNRKED